MENNSEPRTAFVFQNQELVKQKVITAKNSAVFYFRKRESVRYIVHSQLNSNATGPYDIS